MSFVILPDVTCDLNAEIREFFGLNDYIRGHIIFDGERDIPTTLDWDNMSRENFYKLLNDKKHTVSTAPANAEEYYARFREYAEKGVDIISISLSSSISATYKFACAARDRVLQEYPNVKIACVDSFRMSGGIGVLVMNALMMQKNGCGFDEIAAWLEENKCRVHQMGPIDDLMVVARRGRITMGKAIMGSFAGVKPMGDCNAHGYTTILGKAKGIKKAIEATAKYVAATITSPEEQYILVSHTDRDEIALMLKQRLEELVPVKKVLVSDVFMGCAPNIGAGMIGVYYLGKPITEDLAEEKETLNRVLGK